VPVEVPEQQWIPRSALVGVTAVLAAVATLWFGFPDGATAVIRPALGVLSVLAVTVATALAIRQTTGRERTGWWLMAIAPPLWLLPGGGFITAAAFCAGMALVVLRPEALRDRLLAIDLTGLFVVFTASAAMALGPELFDRLAPRGVSSLGPAAMLGGLGLCAACVILVVATTRITVRPDAWLLALGLLLSTSGGVVFALQYDGSSRLLGDDLEILIVAGSAFTVAGAMLRRRRVAPARGVFDQRARAIVALIMNAAAAGLLGSVWLTTGELPGALVPAILVTLGLRQLRTRLTDRDHRDLLDVAQRTQEELAAQYRASLLALATALEARDGYTGRHGEETVALARQVAQQLGLPAEEAIEVEGAALLHDVGKIGTPNEILHKPGPLTDEEWVVMRDHPVVGERILRTVPGLERVARAVRHEHERWDGAGYPDGLAGEEIPLASRIVLVCDAYHAMTSDRPYRCAMGDTAARSELIRCAGVQFDPAVVSALLAVLPEAAPVPGDVVAQRVPEPAGYQAST
jgi:HD-GYP domain-containing protein (c-di-GMP phosphodiesterase class II)